VFEGLTSRGNAPGLIVDAWLAYRFTPYICNALAYEYVDVLSRKLAASRWLELQIVLKQMLAIAEFVPVHFSWRLRSPDVGDDHVIDCAMNAGVPIVTSNVRDFRLAKNDFGLPVLTPLEFLVLLSGDKNG
jgi:hypothetical protein